MKIFISILISIGLIIGASSIMRLAVNRSNLARVSSAIALLSGNSEAQDQSLILADKSTQDETGPALSDKSKNLASEGYVSADDRITPITTKNILSNPDAPISTVSK